MYPYFPRLTHPMHHDSNQKQTPRVSNCSHTMHFSGSHELVPRSSWNFGATRVINIAESWGVCSVA